MNFNKDFISVDEELGWHINAKSNEDFASKLTEKLEKRLKEHEKCEKKTRKERHAVFSQCFEQIIRHNGCFGPLLSEIKVEYENCIGAVLRAERDADYLYRNFTTCISGLGTMKSYKEQIKDLERKFRMLLEHNALLRKKSQFQMKAKKERSDILREIHQSVATLQGRSFHRPAPLNNGQEFGKFRVKVLERYTSGEQTNINFLNEELERLKKEIQELVRFFDKRFKLRKTKEKLIEMLMEKEQIKTELKEQGIIRPQKLQVIENGMRQC